MIYRSGVLALVDRFLDPMKLDLVPIGRLHPVLWSLVIPQPGADLISRIMCSNLHTNCFFIGYRNQSFISVSSSVHGNVSE